MAPQHSKIAVDISQSVNSVNNRTHSLRKILRMAITDLVINTRLNGRLTLDPAGMHCPSWDNVVTERIAAKRQTAGIVFTHRPKIRFFAQQGRLVAPIQVKLCRTDGTWVRLAAQNFTSIGAEGWECGPQNIKISTFWQRVAPLTWPISEIFGAFIRLTILR